MTTCPSGRFAQAGDCPLLFGDLLSVKSVGVSEIESRRSVTSPIIFSGWLW
jgi:hypothetical protein